MLLPTPKPEFVGELQELYQRKYGIALTADEAYEALRVLMTHIYLKEYEPIRPLREKV